MSFPEPVDGLPLPVLTDLNPDGALAEPSDSMPEPGSTRIRLDVAYDGTGFFGWARQPGYKTIQGQIEEGLGAILKRHQPTPDLVVAGRTDSGVHALGQVAHFDLNADQVDSLVRVKRGRGTPRYPNELASMVQRRLGGILVTQPEIVIRSATIAPPGFDARFSALWRRYEYRIADTQALHDPLQRMRTTWHGFALDLPAMQEAAATLIGLHDFATYCKPRPGATTIRTLQSFDWRRDPDGVLVATVQADAFCHSMVRALVGACVSVGEGKLVGTRLVDLRIERARTSEFKVMQAHGLTLMEVGYPEDAGMAIRAAQTRARRELPEDE
ncbi:tRNA pseudouridine(38-40) synthase TruA [Cryobacterium arcticum]|uniref:tRNA pseudouridine synthase A n=1 Tax=Cryobacterium arcticum TaxID=670052 RepID=A0A1B1BMV4_9MICO|nr:tRNA pseudouridine synthase A [Cryobacterium arcticum]